MAPNYKQLADIITWARALLAPLFILLGFTYGPDALPAVVILVVKKTMRTHIDPSESQVIESLLVLYPDGEKKTFPMPEDRMSIGRHSSNVLMLKDSKVSSFHAEILAKPGKYVVKDLNSTNGVLVNDKKVSKKAIHPGDVIKIGNTTITTS